MFQLTMLPASDGDCLVLSYGEGVKMRHIVVDGGRTKAYPELKTMLAGFKQRQEPVDLLVLSHIDADHIEGFLPLAAENPPPADMSEVWYNGFDQLAKVKPMGPGQGDRFSVAIEKCRWKLNTHFAGGTVVLADDVNPLTIVLASGLKIILLSPDWERLRQLRQEWDDWRTEQAAKKAEEARKGGTGVVPMGPRPFPRVLDVAKLAVAPETIDDEAPNGSSIAFVAEWKNKRVLLAADAHPDLLARTIAPLAAHEGGRYRLDLFKVSHHGSAKNTTRTLLGLLDCKRFAISTDGSRHGHPDPETIAKLITHAPVGEKTFYFNYRQPRTLAWDNQQLREKHSYKCEFPGADSHSITVFI